MYEVAELGWWFGITNYGFLHCSFFGLCFATFVFLHLSFFRAHIVLEDWVDLWVFLVSSKENSISVIADLCSLLWSCRSPLEGDVIWFQHTQEAIQCVIKTTEFWHLILGAQMRSKHLSPHCSCWRCGQYSQWGMEGKPDFSRIDRCQLGTWTAPSIHLTVLGRVMSTFPT